MANARNRALWWTLVASLLVYVVVAHVAAVPHQTEAPLTTLAGVFVVMSIATGAGSLVFRSRALVGPIQRGELDPATPEGQARAFQPFVVNLALSESLGIYGLVLAFLTGEGAYSLPFVLAALALLYVHRPTAPDLVPPPDVGGSGDRPPPIA